MTPILAARGVEFRGMLRYPDLEVAPDGATFLTGPSGCGKSTLLKLFNGVLSPSTGTIFYCGRDVAALDAVALRREVLLAGQSAFLFPGSIEENVRLYYEFRDEMPPSAEVMAHSLALCQVPFLPDARCDKMSGGERQRVFLALCLSFRPRVLLLDEPTSALDETTADRLLTAVKAHCGEEGVTLVVVSHDEALVRRHADHRLVLGGGAAS